MDTHLKNMRCNMKTIQIDEQMMQVGERAGQEAYDRFVQEGIAHWHKERAEKERKKQEAEKTVKPGDKP